MPLYAPPSQNAIQKTLAVQLSSTATTGDAITFADVTGIQNKPGVLVINRVTSAGVDSASSREYISYSGTSGVTVLIATRNVDGGSSAKTHVVGSIVEFIPDVVWAQSHYDALANVVDTTTLAVDTTKIVTPGATQTITGVKTFSTAPLFTFGTEAAGDTFYGAADGTLTRLPKGSDGQYLKLASGVPSWAAVTSTASVTDEDNSGGSATTSSTFANITGADVSVTPTITSHIVLNAVVTAYGNVDLAPYTIQWHDGSTVIGTPMTVYLRSSNPRTSVSVQTIVTSKAAGTYTYTLQHKSNDNSSSLTADAINLTAFTIPA